MEEEGDVARKAVPTGAGGLAAMEMMREDTLDKRPTEKKIASLWLDAWMVSLSPNACRRETKQPAGTLLTLSPLHPSDDLALLPSLIPTNVSSSTFYTPVMYQDPMANTTAYSSCIATADLAGDNEWRLMVAGSDKKLKVWNGTTLVSEHNLLEVPVALCAFYSETQAPRTPSLAVAAGTHVYIYRNLRPYYKFTVPNLDVDPKEVEVWECIRDAKLSVGDAFEELVNMRDAGTVLTSRSLDFLSIDEGAEVARRQEQFARANCSEPLEQQTSITCMSTIKKNLDEWDAISSLYLGTEAGQLYILQPAGNAVRNKFQLPSTPAFVASTGLLDVDYRIVVACRNGHIYTIKNDELSGLVIELESQPCGLVRTAKNILVGCMNNVVHNFHVKGKKNYSLYMPASIQCMETLEIVRARTVKCLIVSLANGELRVYNEKHLISVYNMSDTVHGLSFGRFGREDNALAVTTKGGTLQVKIMPRQAKLEASGGTAGPPPEQDIPLAVPKKTKLYVEQTQRERQQAVDMHRIFQRDLCKLRLSTARAYVKVLQDGQGPVSFGAGQSVRLNATVQGLGPLFKIRVALQNTGSRPIYEVPVMLSAAPMYALSRSQIQVPVLLPGYTYVDEVKVMCNDQNAGADTVRVFVCNKNSALPIISAAVKMPLSEFLDQ